MDAKIQRVVEKMAEIADLKVENWDDGSHLNMEYTQKQEEQFVSWLVGELSINKYLRNTLMSFPTTRKAMIKNVAQEFANQYGFKISDSNAI